RHRVIETVGAVVEDQDVAVLQRGRRMLTRDRWSAELPEGLARLAGDPEDGGGRPVAGEDVPVRQLQSTIALGPRALGAWISVMPSSTGSRCSQVGHTQTVRPVGVTSAR